MKKRQLIATLACLLVGTAGFAGAYTMEQTGQSQSQQEAEISTTEISQVSGVIEPETDDDSDSNVDDETVASNKDSDADVSETGAPGTDDAVASNADGNADVASTGASASGADDVVASNVDSDIDGASASAGASNADADDAVSTNADADNTDADDAGSASADSSANGEGEDDVETVDADAVQFAADLRWPLEAGSVILNYSMDHMVYFETLEQYQYNPAMIISAEVGDKVYVVAEGMIMDISTNEVTGLTVTEDLGDGYTAIYGQLENVNFAVGDTVERGHVLGYVAETTKYYSVEGTNLYFAMELDGESVNPLEYFAD